MPDFNELATDPAWLPHQIATDARRADFLRIHPDSYKHSGFLADRVPVAPDDIASIGLGDLDRLQPETGPLHFIFHTAFCRSTLLARALNIPGVSVGMAEPGIFASLTNGGQAGAPLVAPMMHLLAKKRPGGEAVFAKPTNHSNRLIPALLAAVPDARAVLMTNPLDSFLRSVARKGMMGRRWGRNLFLEMQGYAGMDFGMDGRETFVMSDMQAAGLAWLLNQRFFAGLLKGPHGPRLTVLDGDRFNAERARTIGAVLDFASVAADTAQVEAAANGPVFATHAKLGTAFDEKPSEDAALAEEIAQVGEWVGMIAQQMGDGVPLRQTLF